MIEYRRSVTLIGEPDISDVTIADWTSYCREASMDSLDCRYANQPLIDGQGHIVEVDECKIGRPKFHVGRLVEGMWVLGLTDRQTREIRLKVCPDNHRDAQTLRLIRKHVQPNMTIYTDCWRGYDSLNQHQFQHMSVNHSLNFVDPVNGVHTNDIESAWQPLRKRLSHGGVHDKYDNLYRLLAGLQQPQPASISTHVCQSQP
ncbi:hypothetical protein ANN_26055 [Periplaneta americana]|uniref:ISXO2-like transposase domain-containing protein n=1 Tax=Periplaneta americana TaxID=6978 RepID=A0ABQ8S4X0_PERAM|nr:hypothetical protein ANN_26055 [Periplaneta americana]